MTLPAIRRPGEDSEEESGGETSDDGHWWNEQPEDISGPAKRDLSSGHEFSAPSSENAGASDDEVDTTENGDAGTSGADSEIGLGELPDLKNLMHTSSQFQTQASGTESSNGDDASQNIDSDESDDTPDSTPQTFVFSNSKAQARDQEHNGAIENVREKEIEHEEDSKPGSDELIESTNADFRYLGTSQLPAKEFETDSDVIMENPDDGSYSAEDSESDDGDRTALKTVIENGKHIDATISATVEDQVSGRPEHIRGKNSDKHSSSPNSIFDEAQHLDAHERITVTEPIRKRKRRNTRLAERSNGRAQKRRRRDLFSPPSSVNSGDDHSPKDKSPRAIHGKSAVKQPPKKSRATKIQATGDQPTVGRGVDPLSVSASYKHPLVNPTPRESEGQSRKAVWIPQNVSPGLSRKLNRPSLRRSTRKQCKSTEFMIESSDEQTPIRTSRPTYTSAKGKREAKPAVKYVSPEQNKTKRKNRNSRSAKESDHPTLSENRMENTSDPDFAASATSYDSAYEDAEAMEKATPFAKTHVCLQCKHTFYDIGRLRVHRKNNRSGNRNLECAECGSAFDNKHSLSMHQSRLKHQLEVWHSKKKGPFSKSEVAKLEAFRRRFCQEHGIEEHDFNQMMIDSSRTGPKNPWPWAFISRKDFLEEYVDVLPDRDMTSMRRYKERNFQNVDHRKWSEEDDDLLIQLVEELGTKWTEIGERLGRTQDSVSQRWRHRLKNRESLKLGRWSLREVEFLKKAVAFVKSKMSLPLTHDTDYRISWTAVSHQMGGIRTAQQCSTYWNRRLMSKYLKMNRSSKITCDQGFDGLETEIRSEEHNDQNATKFTPNKSRRGRKCPSAEDHERHLSSSRAESPELGSPKPTHSAEDFASREVTMRRRLRPRKPISARLAEDQTGTSNSQPSQNSRASQADERGRKETVQVSHNPFNKTTPGKALSLSQVFEGTQAPSSAVRQSPLQRGHQDHSSPTQRPSPYVEIRLRPESSPQEWISQQDVEIKSETTSDAGGESGEDDEDEENGDDSDVTGLNVESDKEITSEKTRQYLGSDHNITPFDFQPAQSKADEEEAEDHEPEDKGGGSDDNMVDDTRDDFLTSLRQTAKLSQQWRPPLKRGESSNEEEDDEDD